MSADRNASEFPARPNAAMQEETVKYLQEEDKLHNNPPKDGEQAAADFAKLQKVRIGCLLLLTSRMMPPSPSDRSCGTSWDDRHVESS